MFDIGWPELLIVAVLVIVVVGPKDLPRVMRTVAHYLGKAKSMTREFRGYVDDMVRESDLDEIKNQIQAGADLDPAGLMENTIDADNEIRDAMNFAGGEFDTGEFASTSAEITPDDAGGVNDEGGANDKGGAQSGAPAGAEEDTGGSEKVAS
jgi:sec-independent protein translocase protein TatB